MGGFCAPVVEIHRIDPATVRGFRNQTDPSRDNIRMGRASSARPGVISQRKRIGGGLCASNRKHAPQCEDMTANARHISNIQGCPASADYLGKCAAAGVFLCVGVDAAKDRRFCPAKTVNHRGVCLTLRYGKFPAIEAVAECFALYPVACKGRNY